MAFNFMFVVLECSITELRSLQSAFQISLKQVNILCDTDYSSCSVLNNLAKYNIILYCVCSNACLVNTYMYSFHATFSIQN